MKTLTGNIVEDSDAEVSGELAEEVGIVVATAGSFVVLSSM